MPQPKVRMPPTDQCSISISRGRSVASASRSHCYGIGKNGRYAKNTTNGKNGKTATRSDSGSAQTGRSRDASVESNNGLDRHQILSRYSSCEKLSRLASLAARCFATLSDDLDVPRRDFGCRVCAVRPTPRTHQTVKSTVERVSALVGNIRKMNSEDIQTPDTWYFGRSRSWPFRIARSSSFWHSQLWVRASPFNNR